MKKLLLRSLLILSAILLMTGFSRAQTGYADVTITTNATSNGTWSGGTTGPYVFTPNSSVATANVNVADITARLCDSNPCGTYASHNVTLRTTSSGGTGNGDITLSTSLVAPGFHTSAYTLAFEAGGAISVAANSPIDLTPGVAFNGQTGRPAHALSMVSGSESPITILSGITLVGGEGGGGSGGPGGAGGNLSVTAGAGGSVTISAAVVTSGGIPSKSGFSGGDAGDISITGPNGITLSQNLKALGGLGSGAGNGLPGDITINDGAWTVTSGGGTNDGQTGGLISGRNFTKQGAGTFVMSQPNNYTGTTTVDAGILRATSNNVVASTDGPFGNHASGLYLNGGTIQSNVATFSRPVTVTAANSGLEAYGSSRTISSAISATGTYNLNAGGNTGQPLTLSGTISDGSGTLSLGKTGTSDLTLTGANTFSGGTTLWGGTLNIDHATAIGSGTFAINGGTIGNTSGGSITLTNNNPLDLNSDFSLSGTQSIDLGTGAVTIPGNIGITVGSGTHTIGGAISQSSGTFTKSGSGTLSFGSQPVNIHHLSIAAGTLSATSDTLTLTGDLTCDGTFVHNGGTVNFNGSAAQSLSGGSSPTFARLVIDNLSGTGVTLSQAVTVATSLNLVSGKLYTDATNVLTLTSAATSNEGSAGSFVDGPMRKAGTSAFVFPIGDGSRWARLAIGAPTASTTFEAEYAASPYANTSTMASSPTPVLNNVSEVEYWILDRVAGSGDATVELYWEDASFSYINDCNDLRIAHFNGTAWENNHDATTVTTGSCATGAAGTIATTDAVTSFSPFTFGSKSASVNSLPVELASFTAKCMDRHVELNWVTVTESDNDYFTLERSADAGHWRFAGQVKGAGNSTQMRKYSFTDPEAVTGWMYYRLRGYDAVVEVKDCARQLLRLSVFPNPSRGRVHLELSGEADEVSNIEVFDARGHRVFASDRFEPVLDLGQVPSGVYILLVRFRNVPQTLSKKLLIAE